MDFKFLFYIFLSIVFILGGTYNFYKSGEQLSSSVFFIGSVAAILYFGFRWFTPSGELKDSGAPSKWPPAINHCPDFLALDMSGADVCIDTIGVSSTKAMDVTTGTRTYGSEKFEFPLHLDKTGQARAEALCASCKEKGLTWEGVWNGFICLGNDPPRPPTS